MQLEYPNLLLKYSEFASQRLWDLLDSISGDFDCKAALGGQFQVLETETKELENLTYLSARKAAAEGKTVK